ncbi:cell division protein ZapA [Tellurirhabdus rosea]|uniref:cell division protein ZapA n=1 Tax=Tellurirhabdus rosea TaxID=2674997 RepID=UPI00225541B6|nr:cell division protein ZapA [Tellurirhabdus rosea]
MGEPLSITIRIAGREYPVRVPAEEEFYLREAARIVNERMKIHRENGWHEDHSILSLVALESVVARLKGEDYANELQKMVAERLTRVDRLVSPVLPH